MRVLSWILTIAAVVSIVGCFFREEIMLVAGPLTILAVLADSKACDIELRNFRRRVK